MSTTENGSPASLRAHLARTLKSKPVQRECIAGVGTILFIAFGLFAVWATKEAIDVTTDAVVVAVLIAPVLIYSVLSGRLSGFKAAGIEATFRETIKEELNPVKTAVKSLNDKVERIEQRIMFDPSAGLTTEEQNKLDAVLTNFVAYLDGVGFAVPRDKVRFDAHARSGMISEFNPELNTISVAEGYEKNPRILYHEFMHFALFSLATRHSSQWSHRFREIEAGLANYFVSSFDDNPKMWLVEGQATVPGTLYSDLDEPRTIPPIGNEDLPAIGGMAWASAFWEVRGMLGKSAVDQMLLDSWTSSATAVVDEQSDVVFMRQFLDATQLQAGEETRRQVEKIFTSRGWTTK